MRKLLSFTVYSLIVGGLLASFSTKKQSDKPGFRIIKWTKPAECKETGSNFEVGYVLSPLDKMVEIALYLQLTNGNWVVKRFSNRGSGYFKIGASDCAFTGNHYGFVRYADDKETKFPTVEAVREEHESSDQHPRFKIDKQAAKPECNSIKLETGYVYSPTGNTVEITLFLEKKDKSWRKKIYYYIGTGIIELGIDDCDLTGKFKTHITYFNK